MSCYYINNGDTWDLLKHMFEKANQGDDKTLENMTGMLVGIVIRTNIALSDSIHFIVDKLLIMIISMRIFLESTSYKPYRSAPILADSIVN